MNRAEFDLVYYDEILDINRYTSKHIHRWIKQSVNSGSVNPWAVQTMWWRGGGNTDCSTRVINPGLTLTLLHKEFQKNPAENCLLCYHLFGCIDVIFPLVG